MVEPGKLLEGVNSASRQVLARLVDACRRAAGSGEAVVSDFLDPAEQQWGREKLLPAARAAGVKGHFTGGYPAAERQRLLLYPDYLEPADGDPRLGFIRIEVAGGGEEPGHRQYLGAVLGLGVRREKVGDLLVVPGGCQVIIDAGLVDFVLTSLDRVGQVRVQVREISRDELDFPGMTVREIKVTVASPRLDAVASRGFGLSRARIEREIKAEKVRVNWQCVTKPDYRVKPGQVISCRGRGRLVVQEIGGTSRKQRLYVTLQRLG